MKPIVLITGASQGIGAAITACLRRDGATVLVTDANPATSPDVVADVSSTADVDRLFGVVRERLGGEPDEFTFTEVTDFVEDAQDAATDAADAAA